MMDDTSKFRFLHVMIRVFDLDKSVDFYTRLLGMKEQRRTDFEKGRFTLCFLGYGDEESSTVIELTHNWDQKEVYEVGTGFGHLAIAVPDVYHVCNKLRAEGCMITREPGPMKYGTRAIAFIEDPDGYKIELVQRT